MLGGEVTGRNRLFRMCETVDTIYPRKKLKVQTCQTTVPNYPVGVDEAVRRGHSFGTPDHCHRVQTRSEREGGKRGGYWRSGQE